MRAHVIMDACSVLGTVSWRVLYPIVDISLIDIDDQGNSFRQFIGSGTTIAVFEPICSGRSTVLGRNHIRTDFSSLSDDDQAEIPLWVHQCDRKIAVRCPKRRIHIPIGFSIMLLKAVRLTAIDAGVTIRQKPYEDTISSLRRQACSVSYRHGAW